MRTTRPHPAEHVPDDDVSPAACSQIFISIFSRSTALTKTIFAFSGNISACLKHLAEDAPVRVELVNKNAGDRIADIDTENLKFTPRNHHAEVGDGFSRLRQFDRNFAACEFRFSDLGLEPISTRPPDFRSAENS